MGPAILKEIFLTKKYNIIFKFIYKYIFNFSKVSAFDIQGKKSIFFKFISEYNSFTQIKLLFHSSIHRAYLVRSTALIISRNILRKINRCPTLK